MLLSFFRPLAVVGASLLVCSLSLIAGADDPPASAEIDFQQDIVYGTGGGEPLMLDLAMPKGLTKAVPGLIFIHGGGWQGGSRRHFRRPCAATPRSRAMSPCRSAIGLLPSNRFPGTSRRLQVCGSLVARPMLRNITSIRIGLALSVSRPARIWH